MRGNQSGILGPYPWIRDREQRAFLQAVAEQTRTLVAGDTSALCLLDPSARLIRLVAGSGPLAGRVGDNAPARQGFSGHMLSPNAGTAYATCHHSCCPFVSPSSGHRHAVAPIRVKGRVWGALCATSAQRTSIDAICAPLLARLAALSASCLAHERVCELALELGELTARWRIAADMHDGVAQTLASARMRLDRVLDELGHGVDTRYQLVCIQQTLDYAVRDLRAAIESLSGQRTSRLDMASVLKDAVATVGSSATVAVRANCLLPGPVADEIQRIVQEAVANADRHAHAKSIDVSCRGDREGVLVRVADDGQGFDPDEPARDNRIHFGLATMRLRAALIGGQLSVTSQMQGGTLVEFRWPGQAE